MKQRLFLNPLAVFRLAATLAFMLFATRAVAQGELLLIGSNQYASPNIHGNFFAGDEYTAPHVYGDLAERAVSRYDLNGNFLGFFVSRVLAGMSNWHSGGSFGPDGNLYVADYHGNFIAKFAGSTGAFLGYFAPVELSGNAVSIAFGPDGIVYVAKNSISSGGGGIARFNAATGLKMDDIVANHGMILDFPQHLVFGADGKLYISTISPDAVVRFDPATGNTDMFVQEGDGGLYGPGQMAFGPDGNLYVCSQHTNSVKRYSGANGAYLGDFVEAGTISYNSSLAFSPDGTYLYVSGLIPGDPGHGVARYDGHTGCFDKYLIRGDSSDNLGDTPDNLICNGGRTNPGGPNVAVEVSPLPTATLTFSEIVSAGQTVITALTSDSTPLPENFQAPPASGGFLTYFDIRTTATFTGSVTLSFSYDPTYFRSDQNPTGPDPMVKHYETGYTNPIDGSHWKDITVPALTDLVNHKVYGVTTSFSPFAIVKRLAYAWSGVLQPINTDGSSVFKRGSTIPVKFKLTGGDSAIANLNAKLYLSQSSSVDPVSTNEAVSNGSGDSGNTFRYDSTAQQYIFNLSTKDLAQGTWWLRIDLGDGQDHRVQIGLKK